MRTVSVIGVVIASLCALVGGFVVWRLWATYSGGVNVYAALASRIEPVERRLEAGQDPDPSDLLRLARDRETRRVLYDALEYYGRLSLFPAEYLTRDAMAEADLVLWLAHPNELRAPPDEIELTAVVPAPGDEFAGQSYCVFRYRMVLPHPGSEDGWLAGVAGPYKDGTIRPSAPGTFSRFEQYDSRTPEEHVRVTHQVVIERRQYWGP